MAVYNISSCSAPGSVDVDFGVYTPIIGKVYYLYFAGLTPVGCYTVNSLGGVAADTVTNISTPNDDCSTCQNCTCHYVNVTILQTDIDAASGNTNTSYNGVVSIQYNQCTSPSPQVTKDYAEAGTFTNDLCVLKTQVLNVTVFYYQNDALIANNYPWTGSSLFDTGSCCVDPTPTPTPTITATVTPTNTETPTPTPTVTETNTPTPTTTPTNTETPTPTPTITQTNTQTPTITQTNTQTPTITPSNTTSPLPFDIYTFRECCNPSNIFRFSFVPGSMSVGQVFNVDNSLDFSGCAEVIPYEATGPIYLGASVIFTEQTSCSDALCPSCPTPTPTPVQACTDCLDYDVYNDNTFDAWVYYVDCLGNDSKALVPQKGTLGICSCQDTLITPEFVYPTVVGICPQVTPTPQPTLTHTPTPSVTPTIGWNYCPVEEYCLLTYFPDTEMYDGTYYSAGTYNSRTYYSGATGFIYYGNLQWCLSDTLGGDCILSGHYPNHNVCPDLCTELFSSGVCVTTTTTVNPCEVFDFEAYFDCDITTTTTTTIPCSATSINATFSAYTTTTTTVNPCIGVGGSITISGYTTTTTTAPTTTTTTTTRDIVVSGDVTYTLVESVFVCPGQTYWFQNCSTLENYYIEPSTAFNSIDLFINYVYDLTINNVEGCYTFMGTSTISPNAIFNSYTAWYLECGLCQS